MRLADFIDMMLELQNSGNYDDYEVVYAAPDGLGEALRFTDIVDEDKEVLVF